MKTMQSPTRRCVLAAGLAGALGMIAAPFSRAADGAVGAGQYPTRPVRFVVPFAAGGPTDTLTRIIAARLSDELGQPFVVENKPGGSGAIGAELVANAAADGYTLLLSTIHHAVNASLQSKLPYNMEGDFTPVSSLITLPIVLVTRPDLPVQSVEQLIQLAQAEPGKLTFASSGNGGGTHLGGELFRSLANVDIRHIPYAGSAPAMVALLGGHVDMMFADGITAQPHIAAARLRLLAVGASKRSALFPDTPTMQEAGVPGYEITTWFGLSAPAGTPPFIVQRLNQTLASVLGDPAMRARLLAQTAEAFPSTPQAYAQYYAREEKKWADVVKRAGIQAN